MKAAIVIERIEPWRGGAEISTLQLARRLAANGVDVTLLTASRGASTPDLRIVTLPVGAVPSPLRLRAFARRAAAAAQRERFDVVHAIPPVPGCDVYQPRGGLVRETLARNVALRPDAGRRFLKRVASALNVKRRAVLDFESRVCRPGGPVILAVSQYVAEQLRAQYGLAPPQVRVVFNGVEIEAVPPETRLAWREEVRSRYGVDDGTMLALCVAHNFRLKGVGPLIEAVARAGRPLGGRIHLIVVGRDNPVRYIDLGRRLGIGERVTFAGPTQRIGAFYAAADVCAHPTWYDPCSRVVLEAASRGLPCITTRYNGASEALRDGVHGFVLDRPDDVDALADRLVRMADADLRQRMSIEAARLAPALSMARHAREVLEVYRGLALRRTEAPATATRGSRR